MSALTPTVRWAQRSNASDETKNIVFLTIEVFDVKNVQVDLTSTTLTFSADSQNSDNKYEWKVEFFDEIDTENSKKNLGAGSHVSLLLRKAKKQEEYWPRLTKEKVKYRNIKTDFDKWVEEDEQDEKEEEPDLGMGGMPGAGGMGGAGGAGGMPDLASMMQGMGGGAGGAGGMPDLASMMQGMGGGAGGAGGMPDLASMMQGMGGGAGGDFDISKLASQLGGAGGIPDLGEEGEEGEEGEQVEEIAEQK
ncbi:p23 chaperone protein wos2 [Yamadazyma tenuis]|uniref:HSP20-like chaperone n=1 Tax=Candida tenuis (strain ATCC 10573 / BCRC 21748 / CBS 615 / JCM 9827 / NBRC 10315 / NRRL Y-1498 / VKM Y-70) TaxID=590646 RepID=G3B085_CANTC|nr:HSP20-like chaperone [Yamadazyma tenuis ATCC 10573]EGV65511.1 HSP20-like chaperone [Yamadazyma tenuis ATCC 10573]WEJ94999.1 p23 chaperone protein wos2 [Yamadazyma tenuis]